MENMNNDMAKKYDYMSDFDECSGTECKYVPYEYIPSHGHFKDILPLGYVKGACYNITTPAAFGKSYLTLEEACEMSQEHTVLYFSLENTFQETQNRIVDFGFNPTEKLKILSRKPGKSFGAEHIVKAIEKYDPEVIFIDSLTFITGEGVGDDAYAMSHYIHCVMMTLEAIAQKRHIVVIITSQLMRAELNNRIDEINDNCAEFKSVYQDVDFFIIGQVARYGSDIPRKDRNEPLRKDLRFMRLAKARQDGKNHRNFDPVEWSVFEDRH